MTLADNDELPRTCPDLLCETVMQMADIPPSTSEATLTGFEPTFEVSQCCVIPNRSNQSFTKSDRAKIIAASI